MTIHGDYLALAVFFPLVSASARPSTITAMTTADDSVTTTDWVGPMSSELRGLTAEEQFAATLHLAIERFQAEGLQPRVEAYFLLSAARAAIDQSDRFSPTQSLAREYVDSALQLLGKD